MTRPHINFKSPELELEMNTANSRVVLYGAPYEDLSMVKCTRGKDKYLIWDAALMELMAKAGFAVVKKEEPEAEVVDAYVKRQIGRVDEEWEGFQETA